MKEKKEEDVSRILLLLDFYKVRWETGLYSEFVLLKKDSDGWGVQVLYMMFKRI